MRDAPTSTPPPSNSPPPGPTPHTVPQRWAGRRGQQRHRLPGTYTSSSSTRPPPLPGSFPSPTPLSLVLPALAAEERHGGSAGPRRPCATHHVGISAATDALPLSPPLPILPLHPNLQAPLPLTSGLTKQPTATRVAVGSPQLVPYRRRGSEGGGAGGGGAGTAVPVRVSCGRGRGKGGEGRGERGAGAKGPCRFRDRDEADGAALVTTQTSVLVDAPPLYRGRTAAIGRMAPGAGGGEADRPTAPARALSVAKGAYRGKSPRRSGAPRPPPSCPLCPSSESVPGLDRPVPCKTSAHRRQSPGSIPRAPQGAVQIVLSTRSPRLPTAAQRSHPRPRHRTSSPDPDRRRCSDRPQRKPRRPKPAARGQPSPPPGAPSRANPRGAPTRRRGHRPRRCEEPLDGHRDAGHRRRRRRGRRPSAG